MPSSVKQLDKETKPKLNFCHVSHVKHQPDTTTGELSHPHPFTPDHTKQDMNT